jgi:hypothetical protein
MDGKHGPIITSLAVEKQCYISWATRKKGIERWNNSLTELLLYDSQRQNRAQKRTIFN